MASSKSQLKRIAAQQGKPQPEFLGQTVEILFVLDESGSMDSTKADAIGGYNAFLREQRKQPGEARVTLVKFQSPSAYQIVYLSQPVAEAPELTEAAYRPGGSTALLDAVGSSVTFIRNRIKGQPNHRSPPRITPCPAACP